MTSRSTSSTTANPGLLRAVQVLTALTVLTLLVQFASAGRLFGEDEGSALTVHQTGAIVLHVLTGLLTVALVVLWRRGGPLWPAVLGGLVFVATFVQAALGSYDTLYLHVPGALILTVGTVWLTAWAFGRRA